MQLKLYLIFQTTNTTYDSYRSAVVAAPTAESAKLIHPDGSGRKLTDDQNASWVESMKEVSVVLLGTAERGIKPGVICANMASEPVPDGV